MSLKVSLAARWYMIEEGSGKRSRGGEGSGDCVGVMKTTYRFLACIYFVDYDFLLRS